MSSTSHTEQSTLLRFPRELRIEIFRAIGENENQEELQWQRNRSTQYDGFRFACRLLYDESQENYVKYMTVNQPLTSMEPFQNKSMFKNFRSLQIEFDFAYASTIWHNFEMLLNRFQSTLLDLGIFFVGTDAKERAVRSSGCALLEEEHFQKLDAEDQEIERKLGVLRQMQNLRHLYVLRIENMNMPITPAVFMLNKNYLRALSVRTDPRSILHRYSNILNPAAKRTPQLLKMRKLIRPLIQAIDQEDLPPIRALELDVNAICQATDVAVLVSKNLEHLSWRVPPPTYQKSCVWNKITWNDSVSAVLLNHLRRRAANLKTLRLCLRSEDCMPDVSRTWLSSQIVTIFAEIFPELHTLQSLELHCAAHDEFDFFRTKFISYLPPNLKRLYLSDLLTQPEDLYRQVWQRCFGYYLPKSLQNDGQVSYSSRTASPRRPRSIPIELNSPMPYSKYNIGLQEVVTNDRQRLISRRIEAKFDTEYRCRCVIGEELDRKDRMAYTNDCLAFVTLEFDNYEHVGPHNNRPTSTILMLTLNGRLIDKEHNRHLLRTKNTTDDVDDDADNVCNGHEPEGRYSETATFSAHPQINLKLYEALYWQRSEDLVIARIDELNSCEALQTASWDWYFGHEDGASVVFDREPVARIEDQQHKPDIDVVNVEPARRCRWMCPDARVGSIASFPRTSVPEDWRE